MPAGNECKYKENDLVKAFDKYIEHCKQNEYLPNIAGMCAYLDIARDTWYNYKENFYTDTCKKLENKLEDRVINGPANDALKIFYMKNKFGYRDKQEIEQKNDNYTNDHPAWWDKVTVEDWKLLPYPEIEKKYKT